MRDGSPAYTTRPYPIYCRGCQHLAATGDCDKHHTRTFSAAHSCQDYQPRANPRPSAADFNAKLKERGFTEPSEEAQRMNLEDCERYLQYRKDEDQ